MTATTLVCVECSERAVPKAYGWEAHRCDLDDDGQDDILVYCPVCAVREFHCDRD